MGGSATQTTQKQGEQLSGTKKLRQYSNQEVECYRDMRNETLRLGNYLKQHANRAYSKRDEHGFVKEHLSKIRHADEKLVGLRRARSEVWGREEQLMRRRVLGVFGCAAKCGVVRNN